MITDTRPDGMRMLESSVPAGAVARATGGVAVTVIQVVPRTLAVVVPEIAVWATAPGTVTEAPAWAPVTWMRPGTLDGEADRVCWPGMPAT